MNGVNVCRRRARLKTLAGTDPVAKVTRQSRPVCPAARRHTVAGKPHGGLDVMHKQRQLQQGQGLVQCMVGMSLSLLVVVAAFSAFAWIQRTQLMLQTQAQTQLRLHTAIQLLRERVQRAGAPELSLDAQGMAVLQRLPSTLSGSDTGLQLNQWRSLTPADCQGHEASTLPWLQDDFRRNMQRELNCKDTARAAIAPTRRWPSKSTICACVTPSEQARRVPTRRFKHCNGARQTRSTTGNKCVL